MCDLVINCGLQESFSQSLQVELDKEETELAEKKEELRVLKEHIRTEAAEMVARRKRLLLIRLLYNSEYFYLFHFM